jgi:hypothetical protein
MIGWFIWYTLMMSGSSNGGRLIPTPPKHLMMERPVRPVKKKNKKKEKKLRYY